jgi:hypothetical protein
MFIKNSINFLNFLFVIIISLSYVNSFSGGVGSVVDPYEISTCAHLQNMSLDYNSDYELVSDVDCTAVDFIPIGNYSDPFMGSLNGNFYTISNLEINVTSGSSGLFGGFSNSSISNLTISNYILSSTQWACGAVVGYLVGVGNFTNIETYGEFLSCPGNIGGIVGVIEGDDNYASSFFINISTDLTLNNSLTSYIGGIIGYSYNSVNITLLNSNSNVNINTASEAAGLIYKLDGVLYINNSYSTGKIVTEDSAGGLIGEIYGNGGTYAIIKNSYSTVDLIGCGSDSGGFVGSADTSIRIYDSYSTGLVNCTSSGYYVGGFGGLFQYADEDSIISNSYSTGDVYADARAGGFVGFFGANDNLNMTIIDSYSTGDVYSLNPSGSVLGGFVGKLDESTIYNSYSTGSVNYAGGGTCGGFVGEFSDDSYIYDSYSEGDVNCSSYVGGFIGQSSYSSGLVNNSYSVGDVFGNNAYVGGFLGYLGGGIINNSYSIGESSGGTYSSGGFVGYVYGEIHNSFSTGDVLDCFESCGGFVGYLSGGSGLIFDSFSNSNILNCIDQCGGFVGSVWSNLILNSYSTGDVSGINNTGGFVGKNGNKNISNSFSLGDVLNCENWCGGFVGNFSGGIFSDVYWYNSSSNINVSLGSGSLVGNIIVVQDNLSFFYDNSSTPLYDSWNLVDTWSLDGNSLPGLAWYSVPLVSSSSPVSIAALPFGHLFVTVFLIIGFLFL